MPRIEHVQLVDARDLPRFAGSGVAASVQPSHIRADADSAWRLWGATRVNDGAYPYGDLVRSGATVAFGSDAPVEAPDPWLGIASAVVRRGPGWRPERPEFVARQRMSLSRAIRAACVDAAAIAGEHDRGRLVAGQRADLVVIAAAAVDDAVVPGGVLERVRPELVMIGGTVVFEAPVTRRD